MNVSTILSRYNLDANHSRRVVSKVIPGLYLVPLDQKSDGGVRTPDRKSKNPPTHPFFSVMYPYIQIFDEYFSTFFTVFDNLFVMLREIDSN